MYKKSIIIWFIVSLFGITTVGLFNFTIDPYEQYRKMTIVPQKYSRGRYIMPGMLKNYDYNSLIVGSSMTQNFNISDVAKILKFDNPIKLTVGGAGHYELKNLMDIAFSHHNINQVLYCIETGGFAGDVDDEFGGENSTPFYLYDDNYLNDYKYLLNLDNFIYSMGITLMPYLSKSYLNNPQLQYDTMFQWQQDHENDFNPKNVIKDFHKALENKEVGYKVARENSFNKLKRNFNINFLSRIKKYPNTKFILFYPPRPIVRYITMKEFDYLDDALKFKKYLFKTLRDFDNVEIYDFNIDKDLTYNITLYRDTSHYHKKINKIILQMIKNNKYRVTDKNINKYIDMERNQVNKFNEEKYIKGQL